MAQPAASPQKTAAAELERTPLARASAAWVGAVLGALIAAAVEAVLLRSRAPELEPFAPALVTFGLVALVLLLAAAPVAWLAAQLTQRETATSAVERRRRSAFALLAPFAALLLSVLLGQLTLTSFRLAAPWSVPAGVVLLVLPAGIGVHRLAGALARGALALPPVALARWLGAGLLLLGVGALTALGDPSGLGGPAAFWGTLRRPELDVRLPLTLLLALAPTVVVGARRLCLSPLWAVPALLLALGAVPLAERSLAARHTSLAIERHGALSRVLVGVARRLTDRDRDGASGWFGGGDCNDADPRIGPTMEDVPANGVDEDCSGRDAQPLRREGASTPSATTSTIGQAPSASAPAAGSALPPLPQPLDVVLVTVDTLRADANHDGRRVTPQLDALAARSVVFERAYSLASYTAKSLPPMLIGRYMGQTRSARDHFNRFPKETFVAERLHAAGVRTVSVQGYWYFFLAGVGMEKGFDVIDKAAAPAGYAIEGAEGQFNSDKLTDRALEQLAAARAQSAPFFLWVHYIDPHAAYVKHAEHDFGSSERDRYDSEVAFVDAQLGRLLHAIGEGPRAARTAIVLTSDHGEAFAEHGMSRHGFELWESLVRVPFIVHVPGLGARRIGAARSLIDLAPTLLELQGVPFPTGADTFPGQSLVAELRGAPALERPVFIDMSEGPNNAERQAYLEGSLKLHGGGGKVQGVFDLKADPAEANDLLDDPNARERVEPLVARYREFRRSAALPP